MSIKDLLNELSLEVNDPEEFELVDEEHLTPSEMVEHAEKAQYVADQLHELAEVAEDVADEDKEYMLNDVSVEMMHMCYRNIMSNAGLDTPAHSFESNHDHLGKVKGLVQDIRHVHNQMVDLQNNIMDFSPESSLTRRLGVDKLEIDRAYRKVNSTIVRNMTSLSDRPVSITSKGLMLFFRRDGLLTTDIGADIVKDVNLLTDTYDNLVKDLDSAIDSIERDEELPEDLFKDLPVVGEPLLGNRHISPDKKLYPTAERVIKLLKLLPMSFLHFLKWRLVYVTAGVAVSMVSPPTGIFLLTNPAVSGMALGATLSKGMLDALDGASITEENTVSLESLSDGYKSLEKLKAIFSSDELDSKLTKVSMLMSGRNNEPVLKLMLDRIINLREGLYQHGLFLLRNTSEINFYISR